MNAEDRKRIEKWYRPSTDSTSSNSIPVIQDFTPASANKKIRTVTQQSSEEQEEAIKTMDKARLVVSIPGSGKCIANSLVSTKDGLVYIKDFAKLVDKKTDELCHPIVSYNIETGALRKKKTSHWFNMGKQSVKTITTTSGYTISGTYEHPVLVLNSDGDLEFKRMDSLQVGDVVAISKRGFFSSEDKISIAEAKVLGYLIADGYLASKSVGTIAFSNSVNVVIEDYYNSIHKVCPDVDVCARKKEDSNTIDHYIYSKVFRDYLRSLDLCMVKSAKKRIPSTVLQSSKQVIVAYLQAYFDCGGYINAAPNSTLDVMTASKRMSIELQTLLLQFGIRSSRQIKFVKGYEQPYYRLEISGASLEAFRREIGFNTNVEYNKRIDDGLGSRYRNTNVLVIPNISNYLKYLRKNYFVGHSFYNSARGVLDGVGAFNGYIQGTKRPSFTKVQEILNFVPQAVRESNLICQKLDNYCKNFLFEYVEIIEDGKKTVYDFTVPDTHCFVANGFVNHNTKILTDRVIHLVTERDVDPQRILLLTFTVKAAEEMRERVAKKLGEELANFVECGTFHSWSHRILRRCCKMLGLHKDFSILDSSDSLDVWVKCANTVYGEGSKRGPIKGINNLYSVYSVSRNKEISIEEAVQEKYLTVTDKKLLRLLSDKTRKIAKEYTDYKKKHSMLDFDDFLQIIQVNLGNNPDFRKQVSSKYDYILVDEVQDCNGPQIDILKKLIQGSTEAAKDSKYKNIKKTTSSLFACGDEAQSIYGFRGADFKNMLKFPEVFKANVSMLVTNYRSTQEILDLANAIGKNFTEARWKKEMKGTYHGVKPYYVRLKDETAQAEFVANTIERMIREERFPGREIVVLFRSNSMSSPVEMALNAKGLHFNKKSGLSIFEMSHIKDILAFLKSCYYYDDILSWTRMLELLPKVGVQSAEKIYNQVAHSDNPYALLYKNKHSIKSVDTKDLGDLLKEIVNSNKNPASAVDSIAQFLKPIHEKKFGEEKYSEKQSSINALAMYAKGCKSIKKMLVDLTLNSDVDSKNDKIEDQIERQQGGRITLASCHATKGLEYNNVFIINCIEGKFPSNWFMFEGNVPKDLAGVKIDPEKLDSERRLFYVACTRARHNLILTNYMSQAEFDCYRNSGFVKDEYDTESRFLSEIENLEDLVTVKLPIVSKNARLNALNSEYE